MPYQSRVTLIGEGCSSYLRKITEPRKQKLEIKALHDSKKF